MFLPHLAQGKLTTSDLGLWIENTQIRRGFLPCLLEPTTRYSGADSVVGLCGQRDSAEHHSHKVMHESTSTNILAPHLQTPLKRREAEILAGRTV